MAISSFVRYSVSSRLILPHFEMSDVYDWSAATFVPSASVGDDDPPPVAYRENGSNPTARASRAYALPGSLAPFCASGEAYYFARSFAWSTDSLAMNAAWAAL